MGIEYDNSLDFVGLINRVAAMQGEACAAGLEPVLALSEERVPKESGHLAGTGKITSEGDSAKITYDGPYARYQHEHLHFNHPTGGQPKYLETALTEKKDDALEIVARRIKDAL
jgi:hypothetical protein